MLNGDQWLLSSLSGHLNSKDSLFLIFFYLGVKFSQNFRICLGAVAFKFTILRPSLHLSNFFKPHSVSYYFGILCLSFCFSLIILLLD